MREKSQENWGVGITYLGKKTCLNVAASRLYYGIFQAILWYARTKKSYKPTPGQNKVHAEMADIVNAEFSNDTLFGKRYKRAFREFHALRLTADYEAETPSADEIKEVVQDGQFLKDHYLKMAET